MRGRVLGATVAVLAAALSSSAQAADRVYFTNYDGSIEFANLDGTGGASLNTGAATVDDPVGIAFDLAGNRVFWTNSTIPSLISFARLDGSGGGNLTVSGATVSQPRGLSIDPAAGRLYWANATGEISSANLDGSGGIDLNTIGANTAGPSGVAVDPAGGRVYWANQNGPGSGVSFAKLDGTGGGDLGTTPGPEGVAIDHAAGRVYFSRAPLVSFANLGGGGLTQIDTTGATATDVYTVAVDPDENRVWWASESTDMSGPGVISFANLDGSGGAADLAGAAAPYIENIALVKAPVGAGAPEIAGSGPSALGSVLTCGDGSWEPDLAPGHLYRAPTTVVTRWSRGGADIPGATGPTISADERGAYRCASVASNVAGTTTQESEPNEVQPAFAKKTRVTLGLAAKRTPARGPLKVRVKNANEFEVEGTLSARTTEKIQVARKRKVKLRAKPFEVGASSKARVKLKLPKPVRRVLTAEGEITLRLKATVRDPFGSSRKVSKKVAPKLKQSR